MSESEDFEKWFKREMSENDKMSHHTQKAVELLRALNPLCQEEKDPEKNLLNSMKFKAFWPEIEKHISEVVKKKE